MNNCCKVLSFVFALAVAGCATPTKSKTFTISGSLSNYAGTPLANGVVHLKGKKFKDLFSAKTDKKGQFSIEAPAGQYLSLYVVKDYAEKYLEFWHWGLNLNRNIHRDIKIDTLELYNITAWKSFGGLMIYFRPMSLIKYRKTGARGANDPKAKGTSVLPKLTQSSIKVSVNNVPAPVRKVQVVDEITSSNGRKIEGILVNAGFPSVGGSPDLFEICLDIEDTDTKEKGMGCYDMPNLPWNF